MSRLSLQHRVKRLDYARHTGGKRGRNPTEIVMHITVGGTARSSIDYMNTTPKKKASYNYLIERDGEILRMAEVGTIANHAGDSGWPNPIRATPANPDHPNGGSINDTSIGIAWANMTGPLTDEQIASALWLVAVFVERYRIPIERVLGHSEVSPGRKSDPDSAITMDYFRAQLRGYMASDA